MSAQGGMIPSMSETEQKAVLQRYLQEARDAVLWKLDGLGEYDLRRPVVPTGTNLIGLVKHLAATESGYFGSVFGRPFPEDHPWMESFEPPNVDLWLTEDETSESIIELYKRVWTHSDATIAALELDSPGRVPWWTNGDITLHRILVHMIAETHRHAGHADIVRELIDGAVGLRSVNDNLPEQDAAWWTAYRQQLEDTAALFRDRDQ
jgi:uncharacterized damage-inducible protein DinB